MALKLVLPLFFIPLRRERWAVLCPLQSYQNLLFICATGPGISNRFLPNVAVNSFVLSFPLAQIRALQCFPMQNIQIRI